MGAFTPNSPSVRQQMINGYQLRDRQERGRHDSADKSGLTSPPRRLIMFTGGHSGMTITVKLPLNAGSRIIAGSLTNAGVLTPMF